MTPERKEEIRLMARDWDVVAGKAVGKVVGSMLGEIEDLENRVHDLEAQQELALKAVPDEMVRELPMVKELKTENKRLERALSRWCPDCGFEYRERGQCQCPDSGEV